MNQEAVHLCTAIARAIERVDVVDIRLTDVELPLRRPLVMATGSISTRRGMRISITADVEGVEVSGFGEATPLVGWSTETLEHVAYDLRRVADRVHARGRVGGDELMSIVRPASARFALSSALLDAAARGRNLPLRRMLRPDAPHRVAVNATIGIEPIAEVLDAARSAVADGFQTLKLKIGSDLERDVAVVRAVRDALPDVALRLDPNAAWTIDEAIEALARFESFSIDYVEQPIAADRLDELGTLRAATEVRVAADESCFPSSQAARIVEEELADVLVLKPSLFASWGEVAALVGGARDVGIDVVFTSAIDGAVSRAIVAQMAAVLLDSGAAHGLATGGWFQPGVDTWEDFVAGGELYMGSGSGIGRTA